MARRFPDFILEVEKNLKEGGLSDAALLGIDGSKSGSVKRAEEEGRMSNH